MHLASTAATEVRDRFDPRTDAACLEAERLAREIVLTAYEDAERVLADARAHAAEREAALVADAQAELRKLPPPPAPDAELARIAATASVQSAAILERAEERVARIREAAEAEAGAVEEKTKARRAELDRELRELRQERTAAVAALEGRIASVRRAGLLAAAASPPRRRVHLAVAAAGAVVAAAGAAAGAWTLSADDPAAAVPPASAAVTAPAAGTPARCPIPPRFRPAFVSAARHEKVPLALLTAVATVESRWHVNAHSPRGAIGLLQLMPDTARYLGVDPNDWRQNVTGGARFLRLMLTRYGGNTMLALSGYEAGPARVDEGSVPLQTVIYVGQVMAADASYAGCG